MSRKVISNHIIDLKKISDKPVIIDAGCNRGEFIDFSRENFNEPTIFPIECDMRHVKHLEETYPDVKLYPRALSDSEGVEVTFTQFKGEQKNDGTDRYHQWGNIVGANKDTLGDRGVDIEEYTVHTINLETIIKENNLKKIDYLKMDIEGAEYSVIETMTQEIADILPQISMETHNKNKNPNLIKKLKSLGYSVEEHTGEEIYAYK